MGFTATIVAFIIIVYCEGVRIEIPVAYAKFRGYRGTYPVKLFYVSNIPVILASALFADVFFLSNILWNRANRDNTNPWLNWIGMYDPSTNQATGGLAYYLSAPRSLFGSNGVVADPVRAVVYTLIMVGICVVFSLTWVEIGGLSAKTVSKQLIDSGMQVPGFRRSERSIQEILNRYIPVVTVLGGALVGLIAALSDFFNTFGTGVGILLTTGIMWQYYQLLVRERVEEMYPGLSKFIGKG
jgi:preprotein translocase subunit SecY/protein transport protein SEC61 subunit alpha